MPQHPKVTVGWTIACLEEALNHLGDTPAERRVRRQFHQHLLALERDGYFFLDQRGLMARSTSVPIASPGRGSTMPS